jgi:hypothetical protein
MWSQEAAVQQALHLKTRLKKNLRIHLHSGSEIQKRFGERSYNFRFLLSSSHFLPQSSPVAYQQNNDAPPAKCTRTVVEYYSVGPMFVQC